jgi:hypothetical protein
MPRAANTSKAIGVVGVLCTNGRVDNFSALLDAGADAHEASAMYCVTPICSPVSFNFNPRGGAIDSYAGPELAGIQAMLMSTSLYNFAAGFERFMPGFRQASADEARRIIERAIDAGADPTTAAVPESGGYFSGPNAPEGPQSALERIRNDDEQKEWADAIEARWRARAV